MKKVNTTQKSRISLTAKEWELYVDSMNCDEVAKILNDSLDVLIKNARKKIATGNVNPYDEMEDVGQTMWEIMDDYKDYGAYDTEPRRVLENILNQEFGLKRREP
jgi:hypothetical protein